MLKLSLILSAALFAAGTVRADGTLPESLKDFSRIENDRKQESFTADFADGLNGWSMTSPEEFKLERHGGRNEGAGLKISRGNSANYNIIGHSLNLIPGGSYELSFWVKTADVRGPGIRAGVEFYARRADGTREYLFPTTYTQGISGSRDWTKVVLKIPRVPARTEIAGVAFFLDKKSRGSAWIDDVVLRPAEPSLVMAMIQPHGQRAVPGAPVTLRLVRENGALFSGAAGSEAHLQFDDDSGEGLFIPVMNAEIRFRLPPELPDGEHRLTCRIVDRRKKRILETVSLPFQAGRPSERFTFSPTGVMILNGKKFMPLGFYINGLNERTIRLLGEAGGNVVMPYGSLWIGKGRDGVRRKLDRLAKANLKIIFSLKDVYAGIKNGVTEYDGLRGDDEIVSALTAALKKHPALLAWYINDELTFSPMLAGRRDLLSKLDPDHPVWSVQYQIEELPVYARIADVIGLSLYPVKDLPPEKTSIGSDAGIRRGKETGIPFWAVPQIHNLSIYDSKKCRSPEPQEIRTMALLQVGLGAKGFIFYMLDDLWHPKAPAGNFEKVWPGVVAAFRDLRELEPFITGEEPAEEMKIIESEGRVRAFRMRNGDDERIIVTALGPGKSRATLAPGEKQFRSLHGRCVTDGGRIVFRGTGIDSDVLIPE